MPEKNKALILCYRCASYRIVKISESEMDKFDSECSVHFINENTRIPKNTIIISDTNDDVLICPTCGIERV